MRSDLSRPIKIILLLDEVLYQAILRSAFGINAHLIQCDNEFNYFVEVTQ